MSNKIRVAVLFGGRSAEHEISLLSAKSVIDAIDKNKYELVLIGINKTGEWFLYDDINHCLLNADNAKHIQLKSTHENVTMVPREVGNSLVSLSGRSLNRPVDVVFPLLHGPFGEDGTVQGLLKLANIPFVGASVLASSIAMDKDVMKRLFRDAGIPTAKFLTYQRHQENELDFEIIKETLGLPFFVKPANLGSSVGISKIKSKDEFQQKVKHAFQFDRKILFEEYIECREFECSILGNDHLMVSLPGELIPRHEFYTYEAKYLDDNGADFEIPANISETDRNRIQDLAQRAYRVLCCEGMARVDLFLKANGELYLNEINTIPGFTAISMYPKMWAASGLPYPALIDKLIELALDRFIKEQALQVNF